MSPFTSSIFQEVSCGYRSVFSSNSNLNSPTPQEQSGVIVGADDEDGIKDGREETVGEEDNVGIEETDGDVDGTPRLSSHSISILDGS